MENSYILSIYSKINVPTELYLGTNIIYFQIYYLY